MKKQLISEEFKRMQKLAGIITENEYKQKLIKELQYFHNGVDSNQIINYDDSDIMVIQRYAPIKIKITGKKSIILS